LWGKEGEREEGENGNEGDAEEPVEASSSNALSWASRDASSVSREESEEDVGETIGGMDEGADGKSASNEEDVMGDPPAGTSTLTIEVGVEGGMLSLLLLSATVEEGNARNPPERVKNELLVAAPAPA